MGYNNQGYALISMTNKDVYYISAESAKELMDELKIEKERGDWYVTTDIKSGAQVAISISNVSSVVLKEGDRHA